VFETFGSGFGTGVEQGGDWGCGAEFPDYEDVAFFDIFGGGKRDGDFGAEVGTPYIDVARDERGMFPDFAAEFQRQVWEAGKFQQFFFGDLYFGY
jgi:hypothetical protein